MKTRLMAAALICALMGSAGMGAGSALELGPLGSGFTYQGSLSSGGTAVSATADFEFSLWDAGVGGNQVAPMYPVNGASVDGGLFTVELDFGVEVFYGDAVWLEVAVRSPAGGGIFATLQARQSLRAVPYSLQTRGMFVNNAGNVGIGTTNPTSKLTVEQFGGGNAVSMKQTDGGNVFATVVAEHAGSGPGILAMNSGTGRAGDFRAFSGTSEAVRGLNQGMGHAGLFEINNTFNPEAALRATTNGTGAAGIFDGDVLIGDGGTTGRLVVTGPGSAAAISASSSWYAIRGTHSSTSGSFPGIWGDTNSTSSNANGVRGYVNSTTPGSGSSGVRGINNGVTSNGSGVYGSHAGSGIGVYGTSVNGHAVQGTTSGTGHAGYFSSSGNDNGTYAESSSGYFALEARSTTTGGGVYGVGDTAVFGQAQRSGSGSRYGVRGTAQNGSVTNYGILGEGPTGGTGSTYAGMFLGRVHVAGTLSKSSGSFMIDHPLDPANRYLSHSFVESPDMMNIYNGNAVTGEDGRAVVELPEYFDALNRDFRYQLTVVEDGVDDDRFVQVKVAKKISDGRFVIRTSEAGVEVSWQVTGVRRDAWAEAHRIEVESDKREMDRGKYLTPVEHGYPESRAIHRVVDPVGTRRVDSAGEN